MGSFKWQVDVYNPDTDAMEKQWVDIVFSLIRNAEWLDDDHDAVTFDYLDHEMITVMQVDLDMDREYDRDLWNLLLQVTNLDAS